MAEGREHEIEWLDAGATDTEPDVIAPRRKHPSWRGRWWYWLVAAAVLVLVIVAVRPSDAQHRQAQPSLSPSRSPSVRTSAPTTPAPVSASTSEVAAVATDAGTGPILDVPASWQLFVRGPGVVERISLKLGRIVTTQLPTLSSDGPVSFLATDDRVIIQPLDSVAGYVVRDGKPAAALPFFYSQGTGALPGPDSKHLWLQDADNSTIAVLTDLDGKSSGERISVPYATGFSMSDGDGYLLFSTLDGTFAARPGSFYRVTTGSLIGVGPTGYLAIECDDRLQCSINYIDRATRTHRRVVASNVLTYDSYGTGMISPDGRTAALLGAANNVTSSVHLLDLSSGADVDTKVSVDQNVGFEGGGFAWSPDSRLLFVTDAGGRVVVIDRASHRAQVIKLATVPIVQLALRVDGASN